MSTGPVTAKGRYDQLTTLRAPYLARARQCAALTIPSLMPPEGSNGTTHLPTPYQSMGAQGVNNLASKLLLALFPPNQTFFRLQIETAALKQIAGAGARSEFEKALGEMERTVQTEVETTSIRVGAFEVWKQLINAGNVLAYLQPTGGMKVFRLDRYVVKRDPEGNVLEVVVHERIAPAALPKEMQQAVAQSRVGYMKTNDEPVDVYTWVVREGDRYRVHQEAAGILVPGSKGFWPLDKTPFVALRWAKIDGEDYGRGHVEEYLGDLLSLDGLSQAIVEGAAAAAKVLFLVNPNGVTQERTISDSKSGDVRSGVGTDVSVVQVEKFADFRVAQDQIVRLEARLAQVFLMTSSIRRDAERVTAEEISRMANELEDTLGGVYSIMSQEFQLPLVRRLMHQMETQGRLPVLPEGMVKPSIVTGIEALGRGHELNRMVTFSGIVARTLGPEAFANAIHQDDFIRRVGVHVGIETDGLLKTREEMQAEQQQAQQQAMIQQLAPELMKSRGGAAVGNPA